MFDVRDKGQEIKITHHKPFRKTIVGIPKFLRASLLFIREDAFLFREKVCMFKKEAISNYS